VGEYADLIGWPSCAVDEKAGERALQRYFKRRSRLRNGARLRESLRLVDWTFFWTQTFRVELGVSSSRVILDWWKPLLLNYCPECVTALFLATEPHRRAGAWHTHMLVQTESGDASAWRRLKEWTWPGIGIARIYPYKGNDHLEYTVKYCLKGRGGRGYPWAVEGVWAHGEEAGEHGRVPAVRGPGGGVAGRLD
jgi:hypothetical protein